MSRDDAAEAIRDWEVSRVRRRHGVFLFRYTPNRVRYVHFFVYLLAKRHEGFVVLFGGGRNIVRLFSKE